MRFLSMCSECSMRRLNVLTSILNPSSKNFTSIRYVSVTSDKDKVSVGDVSIEVKKPSNPHLVPILFKSDNLPQSVLRHLRWIMQKDLLGQDVFLIGPPGPLRRNVAMMYLEMTQKEAEYVSLSRDTTETDLKQRREILSGSAIHIDQCAVRAAANGRVLILEGIEKAERNVLPVLNNLLENREMQLDDGRFLMSASRYDKLLEDHTKEELDSWKLVRVHEDFRVIALGLPVPRYLGNPLDPPLRSRFQARDINHIPYKDHLEILNSVGGSVPSHSIIKLLSFATTLVSPEMHSLGLPDFPLDNLHSIIQILQSAPSTSVQRLLERLYPYKCMLSSEGQMAVRDALKSFELLESTNNGHTAIAEIKCNATDGANVQIQCGHDLNNIKVACGSFDPSSDLVPRRPFVNTSFHDELLADMVQSHMVKDFCIIGPRGCGKSALVEQFSDLLGYHTETIMLYQDMTARDLLQQRMTTPTGDTAWRLSPLIIAAIEGSLAVLDGIHRVNAGTFAVLHRLIHDRELSLFDGTRLLRHDRYDIIKKENNCTDDDMTNKGLLRIHPSFRIVGLSEPPVIGSSSQQWLSSELLTMFLYHHIRPLSKKKKVPTATLR